MYCPWCEERAAEKAKLDAKIRAAQAELNKPRQWAPWIGPDILSPFDDEETKP
jgi:hypothetical protein